MLHTASPPEVERSAGAEAVARALIELLPTLSRLIVAELHDAPHTAGMNLAQFRVLARLNEREYRAAELADVLEVGRPSLTVTVDGLVRRGLVERLRSVPSDRRGVMLRLTPAGRAVLRTMEARAVLALAKLLSEASAVERSALATGLAGLRRSLQAAGRTIVPCGGERRNAEVVA